MIMGIDHGYYAIKTRHFSFPAGVTAYTHEPYTLKNTLQIGGKYYGISDLIRATAHAREMVK